MRITLNINDDIIKKVLEAYVQEKQIENLLKLKGKLQLENNWKELREMELD